MNMNHYRPLIIVGNIVQSETLIFFSTESLDGWRENDVKKKFFFYQSHSIIAIKYVISFKIRLFGKIGHCEFWPFFIRINCIENSMDASDFGFGIFRFTSLHIKYFFEIFFLFPFHFFCLFPFFSFRCGYCMASIIFITLLRWTANGEYSVHSQNQKERERENENPIYRPNAMNFTGHILLKITVNEFIFDNNNKNANLWVWI